ncbi:hypothetical protein HD806DRAFT_73140 [Xylariaceae sp. AK1471]|nr:hypothetical protein HD806DRAFT_73140 [Xylariaceae sp. AK1471]
MMPTPTPSMMSFPFNRLPPELRRPVWDIALLVEAKNRMVLVDATHRTVYPTKLLVSPFLLVNYESRERAKAFYSYREVVGSVRRRRYFGPYSYPSGGDIVIDTILKESVIYLSPEYDTFCAGFIWPEYPASSRASGVTGISRWKAGYAGYCSTYPLGTDNVLFQSVQKVCSMVPYAMRGHMQSGWGFMRPDSRAAQETIRHLAIFPNIRRWFAIQKSSDERHILAKQEQHTCNWTTDAQVIALKGWEGQSQLMNLLSLKYVVARVHRVSDDEQVPILEFMPLSDINEFIDA